MTARLTPDREWWTTAEIAEAGLPDLPDTRRGADKLAERENWRGQAKFARRRAGKGGGWEYSWRLFPSRAQRKLLMAVAAPVGPVWRDVRVGRAVHQTLQQPGSRRARRGAGVRRGVAGWVRGFRSRLARVV